MEKKQENYVTESEEALEMLGKGYNNDPIATEFVSTLSGFTPAPDVLITEYGYVTALVWGRAWRYCQMADGVCRSALEKLALGLGMSERTIIRHLDTLCEGGYLFDTTPDLKNKPHIYADTGKIRIRVNVEAGMTLSQGRVTESQRGGDRESVEESIKKDFKNKPKGDLVDFELSKLPAKSIRQSIHEYFRLNVNWETKTARQWMEWAIGENITSSQIEKAADLWRVDKRFNWQHPTLKGIFENWQILNDTHEEVRKTGGEHPEYKPLPPDPNEGQYVPPPPRRKTA